MDNRAVLVAASRTNCYGYCQADMITSRLGGSGDEATQVRGGARRVPYPRGAESRGGE